MMPLLFNPQLFGPPKIFGLSQNVGNLADIWPELNAIPVFGAAQMMNMINMFDETRMRSLLAVLTL